MVEVHWFVGSEGIEPCLAIRREVFCQEQGYQVDRDDIDGQAIHALMTQGEEAVGTGRIYVDRDGAYHLGRIAVRKAYRGQHLGDLLMRSLLNKCLNMHAGRVRIGAQADKVGFYARYGLTPVGEVYLDEGVPHRMLEAAAADINLAGACHLPGAGA